MTNPNLLPPVGHQVIVTLFSGRSFRGIAQPSGSWIDCDKALAGHACDAWVDGRLVSGWREVEQPAVKDATTVQALMTVRLSVTGVTGTPVIPQQIWSLYRTPATELLAAIRAGNVPGIYCGDAATIDALRAEVATLKAEVAIREGKNQEHFEAGHSAGLEDAKDAHAAEIAEERRLRFVAASNANTDAAAYLTMKAAHDVAVARCAELEAVRRADYDRVWRQKEEAESALTVAQEAHTAEVERLNDFHRSQLVDAARELTTAQAERAAAVAQAVKADADLRDKNDMCDKLCNRVLVLESQPTRAVARQFAVKLPKPFCSECGSAGDAFWRQAILAAGGTVAP